MAMATGAKAYDAPMPLKIAGVQIYQSNMHNIGQIIRDAGGSGYMSYSELEHVLTVYNVDLACSAPCIQDTGSNELTIKFEGENHLTCTSYSPAIQLYHHNGAYLVADTYNAKVYLKSLMGIALGIYDETPTIINNVDMDIQGLVGGIYGNKKANLTIKNSSVQVRCTAGPSVADVKSLSLQGSSDVTFYVWNNTSGDNYAMVGLQSLTLDEDMVFAEPEGGHFMASSSCNIYTSNDQTWTDDIHFATTAIPINSTKFPDYYFRAYVNTLDKDKDQYLTKAERRKCTNMNVSGSYISDMTGIGYFSSVETLDCSNNNISSLYVPESVKTLNCKNNSLKTLDVGRNIVLTTLDCSYNQLTSLIVYPMYGITNLATINCSHNNLSSLYLTGLYYLRNLNCSYNKFSSLDLAICTYLQTLDCSSNNITGLIFPGPILSDLNCSNNTNLTTLSLASTQLTSVKVNNTSLGFSMHEQLVDQLPNKSGTLYPATKISIADVAKAKSKGWTVNGTTGIEAYKISDTTLFPDANFRSFLIGKSYGSDDGWIEATEIRSISSMNVSQLGIKDLKGIEYFKYLTYLEAQKNQLQTLNLSSNTALEYLFCDQNSLTGLDLSNNHELKYLRCNFNNNMTSLNVAGCSKLYYIDAMGCGLSSIDVTSCAALQEINCGANSLSSLNLSNNFKLETVKCEWNQLTSLLLPNTSTLKEVSCSVNKLRNSYMWSTVYSLPFVSQGTFNVVNDVQSSYEENVLTHEQLAEVMARRWTAYHYSSGEWVPYTLDAPTGLETVDAAPQEGGNGYNLQGQRVGSGFKGIVVKNGRKVLSK